MAHSVHSAGALQLAGRRNGEIWNALAPDAQGDTCRVIVFLEGDSPHPRCLFLGLIFLVCCAPSSFRTIAAFPPYPSSL